MISSGGICSLTNGYFSSFPEIVTGGAVILDHSVSLPPLKRGTIKIKDFFSKDKKSKGKIKIFSIEGADIEP